MGLHAELIDRCSAAISENAPWLTELDQAIGDGDHGINMKRGLAALADQSVELDSLRFSDAMTKAGMTMVATVGGASGPLFGTFLLALGKAAKADVKIEVQIEDAVDAVKKRGKSEVGAKTLLDVLVPVCKEIQSTHACQLDERILKIRQVADQALEMTKPMIAKRGRASFLGERSKDHLDPGAASTHLLIHAICDVLEVKQ